MNDHLKFTAVNDHLKFTAINDHLQVTAVNDHLKFNAVNDHLQVTAVNEPCVNRTLTLCPITNLFGQQPSENIWLLLLRIN